MSYVKQLLEEIAKEMGRPLKMVEDHIKTLEDNWYDTKEALQDLDEKTMDSLNIPKRLQNIIKEKVSGGSSENNNQSQNNNNSNNNNNNEIIQQQQQLQQQQIQKQIQQQIYQQGQQQQQQKSNNNNNYNNQNLDGSSKSLNDYVDQIHFEINENEKFIACMQLLYKVLFNINQKQNEEKFRILKKSNEKLNSTAFQYSSVVLLFKERCGFEENQETYFLQQHSIDSNNLNRVMKVLQERAEAIASIRGFNATQSTSTIVGKKDNQTLMEKAGVTSFYDQLTQLKMKRQQVMSQPIKDRQLTCFVKGNEPQLQYEESQDKDYKDILKQAILKMGQEEIGFSSRRKQEYDDLIKQPTYPQTIIRIKFTNDIVLQLVLSPLETIKHLYDLVRENLQDPSIDFYLFETPPMRKYGENEYNLTFDELEALPGGNFYFGLKDSNLEKSEKYFLKKTLIAQALTQQFNKQQQLQKQRDQEQLERQQRLQKMEEEN